MSDTSEFKCFRDLRTDYEQYIRQRLDTYNLVEIYDTLIKEGVLPYNIGDLIDLAYRLSLIRGHHQESIVLKKYLSCYNNGCCNNLYDYLDCISLAYCIVTKKSFSCLYI